MFAVLLTAAELAAACAAGLHTVRCDGVVHGGGGADFNGLQWIPRFGLHGTSIDQEVDEVTEVGQDLWDTIQEHFNKTRNPDPIVEADPTKVPTPETGRRVPPPPPDVPTPTPTPDQSCTPLNTGTAVPVLLEGDGTWGRSHIDPTHSFEGTRGMGFGRFKKGVAQSLSSLQAILDEATPLAKGNCVDLGDRCRADVRIPDVGVIGRNNRAANGLRIITGNGVAGSFNGRPPYGVITMFPVG